MRRFALVLLLVLPFAVPSVHAVIATCGDAGVLVMGRGVCTEVTVDNPFGVVPSPLFPQTHPCPTWTRGGNVSYNGSWAMLCLSVNVTEGPHLRPSISLTPCGPGIDPRVGVAYQEVLICVIESHRLQPVERPPIDLHLCPGGFDPAITLGGTVIRVCVVVIPRS